MVNPLQARVQSLATRIWRSEWFALLRLRTIAKRLSMITLLLLASALTMLLAVAVQGQRAETRVHSIRADLDRLDRMEALQFTAARFSGLATELGVEAIDPATRRLRYSELESASADLNVIGTAHDTALSSGEIRSAWPMLMKQLPQIVGSLGRVIPADDRLERAQRIANLRAFDATLRLTISDLKTREAARRHQLADEVQRIVSTTVMLIVVLNGYIALTVVFLAIDLLRNVFGPAQTLRNAARAIAEGKLEFRGIETKFVELAEVSDALLDLQDTVVRERNASNIDALTRLPNRAALFALFDTLEERDRVSLALIDIDRFKQVNDQFGHSAGDELIKEVGRRLQAVLPAGSVVARFGGDELCAYVVLPRSEGQQTIADRMVREMRVPFDIGVATVTASVSVGITDIARRTSKAKVNELLHEADLALYAAKNSGRDKAVEYEASLAMDNSVRRSLEGELLQAVEANELQLAYQPIHSLNDASHEVEALVRWKHKDHGEISPMLIIDVAEKSGQMIRLGDWIIEQALDDLVNWPKLRISINLSVRQLQSDGFATRILEMCRSRRITPSRVILEVTETIALEQNDRALLTLGLLKGLGFKIALDDFGAGYSSLWLLKSFEFDRLKLDRSLIADLSTDETSRAVFETAVMLGRRLGLQVVAEGVTDSQEMTLLERAGCTHLQGFYFSRPLDAEGVADYFNGGHSRKRARSAITRDAA